MKMDPSHTWRLHGKGYKCINCQICSCHSDLTLLAEPCPHSKEKSVVNEEVEIHPSHAVHIVDGELACRRCKGCEGHTPDVLLEECKYDLLSKGFPVDDQEIKKDQFVLTINVYAKNEEYLRTLAAEILKDLTIGVDDPDHASDINIQIDRSY